MREVEEAYSRSEEHLGWSPGVLLFWLFRTHLARPRNDCGAVCPEPALRS